MWVEQEVTEQVEEGEWWPGVKTWRLGLWLENATLNIPVPEEFKV